MGVKILKIISRERLEQGIFRAEAIFPSENSYEAQIRDPFLEPGEIETNQEERLRWYFEELLSSPYTDREKSKRAQNSIAYYGESLFSNLFQQNEALAEWRNLVNGLDKIRIQVFSKDPEFQALHFALGSVKRPEGIQILLFKRCGVHSHFRGRDAGPGCTVKSVFEFINGNGPAWWQE